MKPLSCAVFVLMMLALPSWSSAATDAAASQKALDNSLQNLKKDLDAISRSATELLAQKKEQSQEKLENYRKQLNRQMDTLEEKIGRLAGESQEKIAQHIKTLKEKNRQMTETAQAVLTQAEAEFSKQLNQTISALEKNIGKLQKQVQEMNADTRERLAAQIEKLRRKNQQVMKQLSDLKDKGFQSWKAIKQLVYDLWKDLRQTYDQSLGAAELHRT